MSFEVTILGNSSASPTKTRHPSAQYVHICNHHLLVDCGEGTQMQLQLYKIKKSKITQIFISHIHGDHILGLPGLLLSMNLLKRETPLDIFGPKELFDILDVFFKHSETKFSYQINYHSTNHTQTNIIFENTFYQVKSIPLFHRVPTTGFIIEEKHHLKKLNIDVCNRYKIPFTFYNDIKMGKDYLIPDTRELIKNSTLTFPGIEPMRYAYCSDTMYTNSLINIVSGADVLYHEATFMHNMLSRAIDTMHTTARQAGIIAKNAGVKKLIIGHFSSRYEDLTELLQEAKEEFENTEIAYEGKTFIIE